MLCHSYPNELHTDKSHLHPQCWTRCLPRPPLFHPLPRHPIAYLHAWVPVSALHALHKRWNDNVVKLRGKRVWILLGVAGRKVDGHLANGVDGCVLHAHVAVAEQRQAFLKNVLQARTHHFVAPYDHAGNEHTGREREAVREGRRSEGRGKEGKR